MANKFNTLLKYFGFSLFEVTLTLVVSSIALAITGSFVASSVNIVTEVVSQTTPGSSGGGASSTVAMNVLTGDFMNNTGNVDAGVAKDDKNNTFTLRFDIPDTTHPGRDIRVKYICDYDDDKVYRQLAGSTKELFLDLMTACTFATAISTDQTTITLTTNITVTNNGTPVILSEVTDAPYTP